MEAEMKKTLGFILLVAALVLASCASKPPAQSDTVIDAAAARSRAQAAMDKAKSVKADVAAKALFSSATDTFNKADSAGAEALVIDAYLASEKQFLAAYEEANAKRAEAQRQLDLAKNAIKSVEDDAAALVEEQRIAREGGY
jgi:hypothetical protein